MDLNVELIVTRLLLFNALFWGNPNLVMHIIAFLQGYFLGARNSFPVLNVQFKSLIVNDIFIDAGLSKRLKCPVNSCFQVVYATLSTKLSTDLVDSFKSTYETDS
ncbi:hypothetical protein [Collimonas silvisoli]|uniref:hypothetical protein n=1 Tax=Collimonas silvisoli TaxID=2825884 RepID=UPI001B8C9070|nr:hypothetical protein [Collimonas silvisoli]